MASEEELLLEHSFFDLFFCFTVLIEKLTKVEGKKGELRSVMHCGGEHRQWGCGRAGAVTLQRVSSIVREIGEPCLHQSPIKVVVAVGKPLKPNKWRTTFDSNGKLLGFHKALKLIVLGGVDPSIRPEVWEFLLGCYTVSSTAEYRRQLRTARRERYEDLVRQCQMMHSSIGTGSLAYVVGSKVMDVRTLSKDERISEAKTETRATSVDNSSEVGTSYDWNDNCTDTPVISKMESFNGSADLASVRESIGSAGYDSSCFIPTTTSSTTPFNCSSSGREAHESQTESYTAFPSLPAIDLFEKNGEDKNEYGIHDGDDDDVLSKQPELSLEDDRMHSFQISNNRDLVMELNGTACDKGSLPVITEIEMVQSDVHGPVSKSKKLDNGKEIVNRLRISDVPDTPSIKATPSQEGTVNDERVSEWLWTLHRIVVDVVRTDSHLEFYEDSRNLARMSDILAVYAWVDPATGYCQGMSDLLSPFVVLFEDNADAFWCFEMLIRRMRENFRMEGPTGVMKQLETLWDILRLTDREMFTHLSHIGAESLHFAFRMLLVLFRRELSFDEALCMWEMMWAADFSETMAFHLEDNCLEALVVQLPRDSIAEIEENAEDGEGISKGSMHPKQGNVGRPMFDNIEVKSTYHFCGLTRNCLSRNDHMQIHTAVSSARSQDDELPVFCVAAILVLNRHKIIRGTHSFEDLIKTFNDKMLKIDVKRCISYAIKLRKRYIYKLIRTNNPAAHQNE